jgi:Co/Zn/Cd efflux system component
MFMDPVMGVIGAVLVGRWSWQLLRDTSGVLLDQQAPPVTIAAVRGAVESGCSAEVVDIHLWSIGPGYRAAIVSVLATGDVTPDLVKQLLPPDLGLEHVTVEIHRHE